MVCAVEALTTDVGDGRRLYCFGLNLVTTDAGANRQIISRPVACLTLEASRDPRSTAPMSLSYVRIDRIDFKGVNALVDSHEGVDIAKFRAESSK